MKFVLKAFFGGLLKLVMSFLPFWEHLAWEKRLSRMRSLEFSFLWSLFYFIAYDSTDKKNHVFSMCDYLLIILCATLSPCVLYAI